MLEPHVIAHLDQADAALRELATIVANVYLTLVEKGVPEPYAIGTAEALVIEAFNRSQ